jgi:hypothetical protein
MDEDGRDGRVAGPEPLANHQDVRHDVVLLLPRVQGAGAAHAAHNFVEDEQRAVLFAHGLHGREVALDGEGTAGSLEGGKKRKKQR